MNRLPEPKPMVEPESLPARFRIADLHVDVGQLTVTRDGERLTVPGLSFDLLLALARAAPNVVSHDDLMRRVWHGVVVSPETVSQRVKLLRDAIGDDPREPRYVAGVRGRGYRLVPAVEPDVPVGADRAPVAAAPGATAAPAPGLAPASPPPVPPATGRRRLFAAAGVVLVLGAALLVALRPSAVFGPATGPAPVPPPTSVEVVGSPARTVAVLPFQNLSVDPANNFIGLGVAEMVLNRLAGSDQLFVVARSSSFAFENRNVDAREIGRQLGARFLVQGSVQRAADLLRVTVQLVDAETGKQLRALTFDRPLQELFAVQDDIATQVATALDVTVGAVVNGTTNLEAHLEYLRGLEALGRYRVPEAQKAIQFFARAQQLDPRYGAPYAAEARARAQIVQLTGGDLGRLRDELLPLAERAIELAPELGEGYVARGRLQESAEAAERDLRRGIALAPNFSEAYLALSEQLANKPDGKAESLALLERAILVDPLAPRPQYVRAMVLFTEDGDVDAFVTRLDEVLRLDRSYTQALTRLATTFAFRGQRTAEAIAVIERSMAADPSSYFARERAIELYLRLGDYAAVEDLAASLPEVSAPRIALAFARGDVRTAARLARQPAPAAPGARAGRPPDSRGGVMGLAIVAAIVDEAMTTGDYDGAREFLLEHHCSRTEPSAGADCLSMETLMTPFALIHFDRVAGRTERTERAMQAALAFLRSGQTARLPPAFRGMLEARALAVGGRPDEAMRALQEAHRSGGLPIPLWLFERDRHFDVLRGRPEFQAIVASMREQVVAEQAKVERLRAAGTLPRRPVASRAVAAAG